MQGRVKDGSKSTIQMSHIPLPFGAMKIKDFMILAILWRWDYLGWVATTCQFFPRSSCNPRIYWQWTSIGTLS